MSESPNKKSNLIIPGNSSLPAIPAKPKGHTAKDIIQFPNLLPLMWQEYRSSMMNTLRNWFLNSLMDCIKAEREYVKDTQIEPAMTQTKIDNIQSILDKCESVFDIQALADYVFIENDVPTIEEVKARSQRLNLMYPLLNKKPRVR